MIGAERGDHAAHFLEFRDIEGIIGDGTGPRVVEHC